jgi:putative flippase GtrA
VTREEAGTDREPTGLSDASGTSSVFGAFERVRNRPLFHPQNKRLVMYVLVGFVGIGVNQGVFVLVVGTVPYVVAGLLGSAVSMATNYAMNDGWTWRKDGTTGIAAWLWRGVKYGATRVVGVGIGLVSLFVFVELLSIAPAISNVLRIGVGIVWGFGASEKWVWRTGENASAEPVRSARTEGQQD